MAVERTTISTGETHEQEAKDFRFIKPESHIERQGMAGSMDPKGQGDLEAIAQGKDRYKDNEFLLHLAEEGTEAAQNLFNVLLKFDQKKLNLLSAFLSRKNSDLYGISLIEDQTKVLELVEQYRVEPDRDKLKTIETQFEQLPDFRV